tara:strand:+ start:9 stop:1049 length:1041 start_codon:yes stop_codon:yes gene_type:complete
VSFLNKKEQVLDIELTQYGKYMLSKGRLKPMFYIFSDDEVLYNVKYVGGTKEYDRETSDRVQKDTQRLHALYEHDGVESRVLTLNGHDINKIRGHGFLAQKSGRVGQLPISSLYGTDFILEEKMGLDDRNLVRNFIGQSSLGEQDVPSWKVDSLLDGDLRSVNISSSSPNIGIKRPVLNYELDYEFNLEKLGSSDKGFISDEYEFLSGFEKEIVFKDGAKVVIDDDKLLLSVIEQNVPYEKLNFDFQFFEIEQTKLDKKTNTVTEKLKKLYFKDSSALVPKEDEVENYFTVLRDKNVAYQYGHRMFGTIPIKVLDEFKESLDEHMEKKQQTSSRYVSLVEPEDDCP